jgi:hypothetical protein
MPFFHRSIVAAGLFFGVNVSHAQTNVTVQVPSDTVFVVRTKDRARLRTSVTLKNRGKATAYYKPGCGPSLQQRTAHGWESVWGQACALSDSRALTIALGDSVNLDAHFLAYDRRNWGPVIDPRVRPGVYRLVIQSIGSRVDGDAWQIVDNLPVEKRSSVSFFLDEKIQP